MKFFDCHVHFFPDALAGRALPRLAHIAKSPFYSDGTLDGTLAKMEGWREEDEFAGAMALHIATSAHQQRAVNDFAAKSQGGKVFCFGSVFPTAPDALGELERIKGLGLYGVKLHPDYQGFFIEDPCALPLYAKCQELGLPVAFHTGWDPYSPYIVHCHPAAVARVAERFPGLTIIAAHMGGMGMPEEAAKYLCGRENVYLDTAFASRFLTAEAFTGLVRRHGAERVLFATDCPWSTVPDERALLRAASLTEEEREKIAWKNAEKLFGLRQGRGAPVSPAGSVGA